MSELRPAQRQALIEAIEEVWEDEPTAAESELARCIATCIEPLLLRWLAGDAPLILAPAHRTTGYLPGGAA